MSLTLEHLKTAAEKLGVKYELNPHYIGEYYNYETKTYEKHQFGWYFGINNLSGRDDLSWTWFESIGDSDNYYFSERYSCRTGKSNKGWRESHKAVAKVFAMNGIEY